MCLGYFLKAKGMFTKEFLKIANTLVFKVLLPVLLFKNIAELESIKEVDFSVIAVVLVGIVLLFIAGLLIIKTIPAPDEKGVVLQCTFRSNFALIGISLAEMLGGSDGVLSAALISAFSIPIYNILAVISLSVFTDRVEGSMKDQIVDIVKKIFKNPLILGVLSGIAFLLLKPLGYEIIPVKVLEGFGFLKTFVSYVARAASPLSLIVLGGQFDFSKIAGFRKQIIISVAARNFMAPAIGLGIAIAANALGLVSFDAGVYASLVALFGTPVAVSSAIMAEAMGSNGQLASQLVVWTTVVSAFSLFVIVFLLRAVGLL